jgi:type II secretion system protein N
MMERWRKLMPWVGYPVFALVSFLGCLYLTFPLERLKPRIERQASAALGMDVTLGDLSPRPLAGVSAESVNLVSRVAPDAVPPPNPDGSPGKAKPTRIHFEQVVVKLGLLPFIWGGLDVGFWAEGLGGEVSGSYEQRPSKTAPPPSPVRSVGVGGVPPRRIQDWSVKGELQRINLALLPMVKDAIGLPITGQLTAKAELAAPESRWSNAAGTIELDLEDASVGDGKAKLVVPSDPMLKHGLTLTKIRVGRLRGTVTIEKGVASVRLQSQDKVGEVDVEVDVEGRVSLRDPLPYSNVDAYVKFRLNPDLKKRSAAFELLEGGLAKGRRPDGGYGAQIYGLLRKPQARLTPVGGPGPSGPSGSSVPPGRYSPR